MKTNEIKEDVRYIRRGRALIIHSNRILLCNRIGADYWYLPGGQAEAGEDCATALIREVEEEMGLLCRIQQYVGTHEHFFFDERRQQQIQEVSVMFTVSFPDVVPSRIKSRESHLQFKWFSLRTFARSFSPVQRAPHIKRWLKEQKPFYFSSMKTETRYL